MSNEIYEYVKANHEAELRESDGLIQRSQYVFGVLIVIGTAAWALTDIAMLQDQALSTIEAIYYIVVACEFVALLCALGFLVAATQPRDYRSSLLPYKVLEWRRTRIEQLKESDVELKPRRLEAQANHDTIEMLTQEMSERILHNRPINQKRQTQFRTSTRFMVIALILLLAQSMFHGILSANGTSVG